jgi:hypothetical protein
MSAKPAFADPAAVPAPQAFHHCTIFGTRTKWEIPADLVGLPKSSGAFKRWYISNFRSVRQALAARGNVKACMAIKKDKEVNRLRMKRDRDYRRGLAQQIVGENANPWGALAALEQAHAEENLD